MARTQAVYYRDERGGEPVDRFIGALPAKAAKKIDEFIGENLSGRSVDAPPPGFPISSQIEGELRELRIRFGRSRFRILYQRSGNLIVLLHAFEKITEAVPEAEKMWARRRMAEFKQRMNAKPRIPPRAAGRDAGRSRRSKPRGSDRYE